MKKILSLDALTAVVDSREKLPYSLAPMRSVVKSLDTGDYSVLGFENPANGNGICLERKSLNDLATSFGSERERFCRSLNRMLSYRTRAVIVEGSWHDLLVGNWRSKITPASVMGSVISWTARGIPFVMAGSREAAESIARDMLFSAARHRWNDLYAFYNPSGPHR